MLPINAAHRVNVAAVITAAFLENPSNKATAEDAVILLTSIDTTLQQIGNGGVSVAKEAPETFTKAVTVRQSLAKLPDYIISMIDGKPYRTLKRHLTGHGLTAAEYRARYGLKDDYPVVAPSYSKQRSETAKKMGLGRKAGQKITKKK
jgi:predicted transcriptional regulator